MQAFCEKYIVYLIAVIMLILIYKMFTYEDKIDRIDKNVQALQDNFTISSKK